MTPMNDLETNTLQSTFEELRRLSPKVTGGVMRMREEAYRDKAVPAKYKLLTAMSISIALRCEPCIEAYVKMACDKGISQEEFVEFLDVAITMQGCPGEEWAVKAFKAYKDHVTGQQVLKGASCCSH
jgi:AhpD family alkylhydroperoxidase